MDLIRSLGVDSRLSLLIALAALKQCGCQALHPRNCAGQGLQQCLASLGCMLDRDGMYLGDSNAAQRSAQAGLQIVEVRELAAFIHAVATARTQHDHGKEPLAEGSSRVGVFCVIRHRPALVYNVGKPCFKARWHGQVVQRRSNDDHVCPEQLIHHQITLGHGVELCG